MLEQSDEKHERQTDVDWQVMCCSLKLKRKEHLLNKRAIQEISNFSTVYFQKNPVEDDFAILLS
jgi:hypothetical protein